MLKWLIRRRIAAFERAYDYDASYLRELLEVSPMAVLKFTRAAKLAACRRDLPREAWHAARIAALIAEDCGPCTQLCVTMAERDGMNADDLRAVVAADEHAMSPAAALGFCFAQATLARDPSADRLRHAVEQRWGKRALVSLALTIAGVRLFPAVKYALGHGRSCIRVVIAGTPQVPKRAA